jgi:hypothetical protein
MLHISLRNSSTVNYSEFVSLVHLNPSGKRFFMFKTSSKNQESNNIYVLNSKVHLKAYFVAPYKLIRVASLSVLSAITRFTPRSMAASIMF